MVTNTGFIDALPSLVNLHLDAILHALDDGEGRGFTRGEYSGYLRAVSGFCKVPMSEFDDIVCELAELATVEE